MSLVSFDAQQLYQRQFGTKPQVGKVQPLTPDEPFTISGTNQQMSSSGSALTADYLGREIWLPIKFFGIDVNVFGVSELLLPYAVIKMSSKKTMIMTPMFERSGTVKEQYSVEDFNITISGFVVGYDKTGKYPEWPEADLKVLEKLYSLNEAVKMDNALTNIYIGSDCRVVISGHDLPEVKEGKKNYRPFSFSVLSDTIFTLELE